MAKKNLPAASISKGSVVRFTDEKSGQYIGVVHADHTAPGVMQGHCLVAFIYGMAVRDGANVKVKMMPTIVQLPMAKLENIDSELNVKDSIELFQTNFSEFLSKHLINP